MTAGLSLGEYAAIAKPGIFHGGCSTSCQRARKADAVHRIGGNRRYECSAGHGSRKDRSCAAGYSGAMIANYNCPGQIVITGELTALEKAGAALKEAGAKRVLPLKVSGPFHSSPDGAGSFKVETGAFKSINIRSADPLHFNVTAQKVTDKQEIAGLLCEGIHSSVHWEQSVRYMIRQGVDTFVEIGPGRTLAGFMKKIDPAVTVKKCRRLGRCGESGK